MPTPPDYFESNGYPAFSDIMSRYPKGYEERLRALADQLKRLAEVKKQEESESDDG
jgi:hypothetical protein